MIGTDGDGDQGIVGWLIVMDGVKHRGIVRWLIGTNVKGAKEYLKG